MSDTNRICTHAVRLNTPPSIHPVFHVSLVKKAGVDPLPSQLTHDNEPGIVLYNSLVSHSVSCRVVECFVSISTNLRLMVGVALCRS